MWISFKSKQNIWCLKYATQQTYTKAYVRGRSTMIRPTFRVFFSRKNLNEVFLFNFNAAKGQEWTKITKHAEKTAEQDKVQGQMYRGTKGNTDVTRQN